MSPLQHSLKFLFALLQLLRPLFDDDIALFRSVIAVLMGSKVEVEVRASFEKGFFRRVALAEGFLETLVAVTLGFELGLFEDHVEGIEMMLEFEVDGAFGGGEDDRDFVLDPWDFVDIGRILEIRSHKNFFITFRIN